MAVCFEFYNRIGLGSHSRFLYTRRFPRLPHGSASKKIQKSKIKNQTFAIRDLPVQSPPLEMLLDEWKTRKKSLKSKFYWDGSLRSNSRNSNKWKLIRLAGIAMTRVSSSSNILGNDIYYKTMISFSKIVVCVVAFIAVASAVIPTEDGVLVLDDTNFEEASNTYDALLVDFYAPW